MKVSLVAAVASNNVIGRDNKLPWHIPADLKNFRRITLGKPILMGRKTFESLASPLPGRQNIVVSRNYAYNPKGCSVYHSVDQVLQAFNNCEEMMVIGGATFYKQLLPIADRLYLTLVHRNFEGDTFFPPYNQNQWREIEREDFYQANDQDIPYSFVQYERIG